MPAGAPALAGMIFPLFGAGFDHDRNRGAALPAMSTIAATLPANDPRPHSPPAGRAIPAKNAALSPRAAERVGAYTGIM